MSWITEADFRWRSLEPFGVELDCDLSASLSAEQAERFVALLWTSSLLLVRGQHLSMSRQRELCALAGPILLRTGESGYLSTEGAVASSLSELRWHADAAYTEAPLDLIALHAVDVVDGASSTRFISAAAALTSLPPRLRARIEGKRVEMISPDYDSLALRTCDRRDPVAQKRGIRPSIYRNPHNGRDCLWVSELQSARILDMEWEESRNLLNAIYEHIYHPDRVLEHRWRNGDIVFWDNIGVQHMRGPLNACGKRVLQRVIVGTEGVAPHIQLER